MDLITIAFGGAAGAVLRFLVTRAVHETIITSFPLGTLVVNAIGCLLIGLVMGIVEGVVVHPQLRMLVITGFLGALTTFSTFSLETVNLIRSGQTGAALLNVAVSITIGVVAVAVGLYTSRLFAAP